MFFKMVKELTKEDSEILRKAKENKMILKKLTGLNFLYDSIFDEEGNPKNKRFKNRIISLNLGKITKAEYGITNDYFGEIYRRMGTGETIEENLTFLCGLSNDFQDIDLFVKNNESGENEYREMIVGNSDFMNRNHISYNQIILPLAHYFFNKMSLYTKIHDLIDFDKRNLIKISSEDFINNLILLFSAKYENTKEFEIKSSKIENRFLKSKTINEKWLYLGRGQFYPKKYADSFRYQPELETTLWLNENKLILFTSCIDSSFKTAENLQEKMDNPEFAEFLSDNRLNDWLKNIVGISEFGMILYNLLKTKILISNI